MKKISTYKTITKESEGFFKDRGSKFYAFAFHVESEEEADQLRAKIKKKYYDARHHVYAIRIGVAGELARASDDGEPSNSSGPPVLRQIIASDLTNVLVVVVRYFGGVKLGVSGLINAYKTAAADALQNATVITKHIKNKVKILYDYPFTNSIMSLVHAENVEILEQNFNASCEMIVALPLIKTDHVLDKISQLKGIEYEHLGEVCL